MIEMRGNYPEGDDCPAVSLSARAVCDTGCGAERLYDEFAAR